MLSKVLPNGRVRQLGIAWPSKRLMACLALLGGLLFHVGQGQAAPPGGRLRPNIVLILADDLGYGDVGCYNPQGKIPTPHLDRLAAQGMRFTDAHSASAVCSPSRYTLLTGRYAWRTRLQRGVLGGLSPPLIEEDRLTIARLLQQQGYHTACIGKWHLGMGWHVLPGKSVSELNIESREQVWNVDFSQPIRGGPLTAGFDQYFGISASLDMVPYVFIRNERPTQQPTLDRAFPMVLGRDAGQTRQGPAAADFDAAHVLPELAREAVQYVRSRAEAARSGQPFFLYLPLASPHTPILPTPEWQGKSGVNAYADFVMQTDDAVGSLLQTLEDERLADDTIVLFTSDNGCSPMAGWEELLAAGHHPSYIYRGHKADIYEGGHRVPFIVRWPGRVAAGSVSAALVGFADVMATLADLLGVPLPEDACEDGYSFLPVLRGGPGMREVLVMHSANGSFAIRRGPWKLCLCPGSGGWSYPAPGRDDTTGLPPVQLYNLETDPGEQHNVQAEHGEIVARLSQLLQDYVARGRQAPP
ncbi:MAG: arylsulfatase [Pirellulales bacterium]|nr:arylsulfatase [Pirellulales bacterium]